MNYLKKYTLLYVEDDETTVSIVKELLKDQVKEVYTALDGYDGWKVFKQKNPDIVLMDINMPKMNGIKLSQKIKRVAPDKPIVVLTAFNENNLLHQFIEIGIEAYLTKPLTSFDKLKEPLDKIATLLSYKTIAKEKDLALKKSETLLKKAQEVAHVGNWEFCFKTNKFICSAMLYKIFDIDKCSVTLMYDNFLSLLYYPNKELMDKEEYVCSIIHKQSINTIHKIKTVNGKIKYLDEQSIIEFNKKGKPIIAYGTIQEVTEKYQYELKIKESVAKLEVALESAKIGMWEWNINAGVIEWDKNTYEMLGYNHNEFEINYEIWKSLVHTHDIERVHTSLHSQLELSDIFIIEFRYKTANNKWLWVEGRGRVIEKNMYGDPIRLIGTHTDISHIKEYELILKNEISNKTKELKELNSNLELKIKEEVAKNREKDQLLQHQTRLAAIGEMMSNIAHQWRQPLSAITTSISALKIKNDYGILNNNDIDETNETILHSAGFLSSTIDNFKNFYKKDSIKKRFFIIDAIKDALNIVKATYDHNFIKIELDIDYGISYFGSDNLLSQVVLNVLSNSKEAFDKDHIDEKIVCISLNKVDDTIIIAIEDNAGGIPSDIIGKIFDPYFTTKHNSQGTGLGLYMCTQILNNHFNCGTIEANNNTSKYGYGACFIIKFRTVDLDKEIKNEQ
ncbi:response regulator [Arcobacter sp. FWKO B]|uniref:hybrid sensor histidine kinase/response regulator n=1 Tax=Arcobacter sp. FWKO B TaxID=2593672 RepID=UPI0018A5D405|nr:response regulator [Arcobacter sp. FWKO B]QOG12832.1 response regulator [Arcobacter sp. FWKO B]